MRIGLICRPFSFHGGVETATAGLLAALRHAGHDVELISTRRQADIPGLVVRRLPTLRHPSALRLLSFALAARGEAARHGYDLVQSHERALRQDLYRAGEGCHRAYLEAMGRQPGGNPYHRLVLALEGRIFRLQAARHVVAISRQGKEEIERRYGTDPDRVTLVYNGVDLERFHPDNRGRYRRRTREVLGIPEDAWTVLFVGSGFERKGLGPLLEAFARGADASGRLVVTGKGDVPRYQSLAARLGLAERVSWTGPQPAVERLYAAADAVALPALYEPFGNVHLEALASGVPVLSSARAGGSEVVRRGENGWVAADPTAGPIAEGLAGLRDAPAGGWASRTRASVERFTYAAQAQAFTAIYRGLGGSAPEGRPGEGTSQTPDFH
ncbi:MAG: glycosyltransferase family 4 protein [Candidatus Rokuibacteriota bacterium]